MELFLINGALKDDAGRWPQRREAGPWDLRGKGCRALACPVTGSGRRQLMLELCLTRVENPTWMVLGWIRGEIQDPSGMFLLFRARSLSPIMSSALDDSYCLARMGLISGYIGEKRPCVITLCPYSNYNFLKGITNITISAVPVYAL